jgi:hypothetical protein
VWWTALSRPGAASNAGLDADVFSVVVQPDGKVLAGCAFTKVGKTARGGVARFSPDGSLDTTFDPGTGAVGAGEGAFYRAFRP